MCVFVIMRQVIDWADQHKVPHNFVKRHKWCFHKHYQVDGTNSRTPSHNKLNTPIRNLPNPCTSNVSLISSMYKNYVKSSPVKELIVASTSYSETTVRSMTQTHTQRCLGNRPKHNEYAPRHGSVSSSNKTQECDFPTSKAADLYVIAFQTSCLVDWFEHAIKEEQKVLSYYTALQWLPLLSPISLNIYDLPKKVICDQLLKYVKVIPCFLVCCHLLHHYILLSI